MGAALTKVYETMKGKGSSAGVDLPLYPFQEFSTLMGFDWVAGFDAAHVRT